MRRLTEDFTAAKSSLAWAATDEGAADWARTFVASLPHATDRDGSQELVAALLYPSAAGPATDVLLEAIRASHSDAPTEVGTAASFEWIAKKYPDQVGVPISSKTSTHQASDDAASQYLFDKGTREIVPRKLCYGMTGRKPRRRPGAEGARTSLAADEGRTESGEGARREAGGWTRQRGEQAAGERSRRAHAAGHERVGRVVGIAARANASWSAALISPRLRCPDHAAICFSVHPALASRRQSAFSVAQFLVSLCPPPGLVPFRWFRLPFCA